jgi:secondary thiamine-phosphate synthase enzyme
MEIITDFIELSTRGNTAMIDISDDVQSLVSKSGLSDGNVTLFVTGSTGALTTIEYEPGLLKDYPEFFEKIIPSKVSYHHDNTWHDGNGHSHLRASLQGPSLVVPFAQGGLLLGTWQQIIFVDFDNRPRSRRIVCQIIGKK